MHSPLQSMPNTPNAVVAATAAAPGNLNVTTAASALDGLMLYPQVCCAVAGPACVKIWVTAAASRSALAGVMRHGPWSVVE